MDDKKERTVYCGNLSDRVTEDLLYELFLQAGPLESVKIPKGRNFGFITFKHEASVPYAVVLLNGLSLYGREIRLEFRSGSGTQQNNQYSAMMMAHFRSQQYNHSPAFQQYPAPPPSHCNGSPWPESPYGMFREDKGSLLKDRYTNNGTWNRPYPDRRSFGGMSQTPSPRGREHSYPDTPRTFYSPPVPDYKGKIIHNGNHMRDRRRYY